MMTIEKFVKKWNWEEDANTFILIPRIVPGRLDTLEMRFLPEKRPTKESDFGWQNLLVGVETRSYGDLSVSSNEVYYGFGIIEFKITGDTRNEVVSTHVINTLKWVGKSFLK